MFLVNAEVDSMGGGIDGRLGILSTLSMQKLSDLEKTQSELRLKFTAAEKFRRELEFLEKGGDPLDLIISSAASDSVQSTSLTDQHPEQFVTSEAKGSFAVTASPHGDSVGSSGRLGAPSVCEPNSADNLVLFDGDNKFPKVERRSIAPSTHYSQLDSGQSVRESGDTAVSELPKKSYKRRIRSRPNREGALERKGPSVNLDLKGSNESVVIKNLVSSNRLDPELDGALAVETTQVISAKGLDSESSCTQKGQNLEVNNENELTTSPGNLNCNGTVEQNLTSNEVLVEEGSNVVNEDDCKILNDADNNSHLCHRSHNEDDIVLKEDESLKGFESAKGTKLDGSTALETEKKPSDVLESTLSVVDPIDISEQSVYSQNNSNLDTKEHKDSILKEAQIIEVKRERLAGLFVSTLSLQNHKKSQWDFLLEEMSWLANDFAQERLWKVTAAAQISRRVAFTSQIRYQQQKSSWKQKEVAQTLGRAVIDFWHTIEVVKCQDLELQCRKTNSKQGLLGYVTRFLEYNSIYVRCSTAQVPQNPDMTSDVSITDTAWDNSLTEETLVYMVPPGANVAYRKSIESHLLQSERSWNGMLEEVDTSGYDAVAANALDEHDGEMRGYYSSGAFEGSKASQATKKRRNNFKFHTARSYEMGADFPFMEKNMETQPSALDGNWSHNSLNVSLPTNHVLTVSRQRVLGPFSGDSNSFQDKQSTLHGGAQIPNSTEAKSAGDCEKQLQYDSVEGSDRPRKKKKHKHSGSLFDHQWRLDSNFQNDQKNHLKKRPDAHQLDINGTNGLYIQHNLKKLKIRQSSDNTFDDPTHMARSISSPVTSQMSNMSNPKKFMELLVRDRGGRKSKTLKTSTGQPGSSWSLFEDQFLVVLVHDMGPNWELISDAINSSLQFKCIFRSTKECKERHKLVMDRSTGDGTDSAEDYGSSQPYPSTLPGIPEGSARQLFQRLQGPMEEKTLKSHFEKIIKVGQKQHYKRKQNNNQDPKQLQQPHSSYALALSQVSPNNLNGGPVLTPLELCDMVASTPDVPSVGYQGSHSSALPITDQGSGMTMHPGSSSNSSVPYSPNLTPGNELSSASVPLNPSVRDGRFGVPRTGSLQKDDQQRMQQYNQLLSARNLQHSNGSHSGIGRGVRMGPAGNNNIGVMPGGMNRGMTMARPPFHGVVASPSMMNPSNIHLMRPNQNTDHQGQIVHPALGMRIVKERQPQQHRVLQQQQQFATSNPIMPHLQVQVSQPVLPPSVKHPLVPSPTHGVGRNPKTCGNQILNQQRQSQQFQQTKLIKGVAKSSDNNSNHQNHSPSSVASSSTMMTSRPQTYQKLVNLSQVTTSQNMVNSRLVNSSEPPTSKLHIPPPQTSSAGATS